MTKMTAKIKFPILNDVEFFDVIKDRKTIKTFKGNEVNGKRWREISEKIGAICGAGQYRYALKMKSSDETLSGSIRAVNVLETKETEKENSAINNQIQALQDQISNLKNSNNNNIGFDVLLNVTKQGYETQITFLNSQIQFKETTIKKLDDQITDLENELSVQDDIIADLKSKSGLGQYINIVQDLLKVKTGKVEKLNLKDSNISDIPKEILDLLGLVNWSQVPSEILEQTLNYLNMFIPKLPLK